MTKKMSILVLSLLLAACNIAKDTYIDPEAPVKKDQISFNLDTNEYEIGEDLLRHVLPEHMKLRGSHATVEIREEASEPECAETGNMITTTYQQIGGYEGCLEDMPDQAPGMNLNYYRAIVIREGRATYIDVDVIDELCAPLSNRTEEEEECVARQKAVRELFDPFVVVEEVIRLFDVYSASKQEP